MEILQHVPPTKENLAKKRTSFDCICLVCGDAPETVGHALRDYRFVSTVWNYAERCENLFFKSWWLSCILDTKVEYNKLFVVFACAIWRARKLTPFGNMPSIPTVILKLVISC